MLTTAQHKATSAITSAEEQKSVPKWRISTKYPKFILQTSEAYSRRGGSKAAFQNSGR
jgi:hypothetical protein